MNTAAQHMPATSHDATSTRRPAARAQPLELQRLTRNEAQARSVLAQRGRDCELVLGDQLWELSLAPLMGTRPPQGANQWRVRARWAGAPFELSLPADACETWLCARFPGLDVPTLPEAMRAAYLESALDQTLEALHQLRRGPAHIESAAPADSATPRLSAAECEDPLTQHFALSVSHGDRTLSATLSTDALGLMLMAGLAAQREPQPGPVDTTMLPVRLRAEIGCARIDAARLSRLKPGDAIFMNHAWFHQDGELWLGSGHWGLRVRCDDTRQGSRLVVTQPFLYTETLMDTDFEDDLDDGAGPIALDGLPVKLHFDLGERTLTLGEVEALQVGQVLDLARPLSQAVSIRANGALIGIGELMEIGGRVAVGVTALGRSLHTQAPAIDTAADAHDEDDDGDGDDDFAAHSRGAPAEEVAS